MSSAATAISSPPSSLGMSVGVTPSSSSSSSSPSSSTTATQSAGGAAHVCHTCGQTISTIQFIRVGLYKFHKEHFTCSVCHTNLHGKKFHHKDGHFYCADDYINKFCHTCRHCKQKITSGSVIQAFGGYYHPDHFVCTVCGKQFANGKYYEVEESPYCEEHYFSLVGERCAGCGDVVKETDMVRVQQKPWHAKCLSCAHCGCPLARGTKENSNAAANGNSDGSIFQKDNAVYCRKDYLALFCKRCTACGEHILKHCISVNDELYHPDCLQCSVCSKKLTKYICIQGHLRCPDHTEFHCERFTCGVCNLPIDGDVVLSVGKKIHPACFKCATCKRELTKPTAKLKDGQLACQACLSMKEPTNRPNRTQSAAPPPSMSYSKHGARRGSEGDSSSAPPSASAASSSSAAANSSLTSIGEDDDSSSPTASSRSKGSSSASSASSSASSASSSSSRGAKSLSRNDSSNGKRTSKARERKLLSNQQAMVGGAIEWKKGELIGKGSFGKVYMGMNAATGELIAVKQVRLNTDEDQEQAIAIENEIALMENLRHPNIVTLLGTQRVGNKLNILMEYVPGKSLDSLLEKFGAFSEKVIRSYTKQLLEALAYCHQNRVVHRDIKGKNILIDTKGNLKLADFGSAKRFTNIMSKDQPSLSYNYTPLWTAPEVLTGDYNSKVDIWSLGCVIIEMASAKPPWSEQNFENPFRALYHIGNSDAIPKIPDTMSSMGNDFVRKCLTRDPDRRPEAAQMLEHDWMQGLDDDEEDDDEEDDEEDDDDEEEDDK